MRKTAFFLPVLVIAAAIPAQGNEVIRNNEPYYVTTTATSTTGNQFNYPSVNPAEYAYNVTSTVPANTRSWRIIPKEANYRNNRRLVDGYVHLVRLSAATAGVSPTAYEPEVALHGVVARVPAPGLDPNWNKQLHLLAQMPTVPTGLLFTVTRTFNPVSISTNPALANGSDNLALSFKWAGGENDSLPNKQGFVGSWMDGPGSPASQNLPANGTPWVTTGFYYPATQTTVLNRDKRFCLWASYTEAEGTINMFSDWGQRRYSTNPGGTPGLFGHSIGTYWSDLAGAPGSLGISVRSSAHPNGIAAPLFNFGNFVAVGFPFLGNTMELNPADPSLGLLLNAGFILLLDGNGAHDSLSIPIPRSPAVLGKYFGFECYLIDGTTLRATGSTQAAWILNRGA